MTEQEFTDKYCCTDSHAEYCNDDCDSCERKFKKDLEVIKERIRADAIEEVKRQMISLHTDMIFRYGADIIEARCDAFDELKEWLKEQNQ